MIAFDTDVLTEILLGNAEYSQLHIDFTKQAGLQTRPRLASRILGMIEVTSPEHRRPLWKLFRHKPWAKKAQTNLGEAEKRRLRLVPLGPLRLARPRYPQMPYG